jgi:hypothetical protein
MCVADRAPQEEHVMQASDRIVGWRRAALAALVILGMVSASAGAADARSRPRAFKGSGTLTATSADPDARGKVKASA